MSVCVLANSCWASLSSADCAVGPVGHSFICDANKNRRPESIRDKFGKLKPHRVSVRVVSIVVPRDCQSSSIHTEANIESI